MCGICGIYGQQHGSAMTAMISAMQHRGPDDSGIFKDPGIALGMTRLAIIDVTQAAHQPMPNPDKTVWIAYNGEVYNFRTERHILEAKGYRFASSSDTEVVLRMYEHYGDDFLLRLRGMFALAIYDKRRGTRHERLLLARDQLGIKPLLYSHSGGMFVFASEIKALVASGLITPEIDPIALRLLLTFGSVYQPRTMLRNVSMLLPGHRIIIEHGQERIERYWSLGLNRHSHLREQPYEVLVEHMGSVLEESLRLQLVSDVPLGAFLSGGVDSSVLVAMMARAVGHHVKTFSVGFEAEGCDIDESEEARRTAHFLETDHTHVLVTGKDVRDSIHHIVFSLDQPSIDGVNSYFVSRAARQAVTVAISGTGGDELYAGYPWFIQMVLAQRLQKQLHWGKMAAKMFLALLARQKVFDPFTLKPGGTHLHRLRNCCGFLTRYAQCYHIFSEMETAQILSDDLRQAAQAGRSFHDDVKYLDELSGGTTIERVTGLCLRGYTNNQLLRDIDAVSMGHSLEVRVPYLDPLVVDTALSLPDRAKLGNFTDPSISVYGTYRETGAKRILIDAGKPLLPENFDMQSKRGFTMPFDVWLKGPLRDVLSDSLSDHHVRRRGLLDVKTVAALKKQFEGGKIHWTKPWLLMMLELWCREVLDQPPARISK